VFAIVSRDYTSLFSSKARACPSKARFLGFASEYYTFVELSVKNTSAYYGTELITAKKSFIIKIPSKLKFK
jgi:hypothetical protein